MPSEKSLPKLQPLWYVLLTQTPLAPNSGSDKIQEIIAN
jgi:hypothetical protein